MRGLLLTVNEGNSICQAECDQSAHRQFGGIAAAAEHGLSENHGTEIDAVEPARKLSIDPGFHAVRMTCGMQLADRPGSWAAESRCPPDLCGACAHRPGSTRSKSWSNRMTSRWSSRSLISVLRSERCNLNWCVRSTIRGSVDHQRIGCPALYQGKMPSLYARRRVSTSRAPPAASKPGAGSVAPQARSTAGNGSPGLQPWEFRSERGGGTTCAYCGRDRCDQGRGIASNRAPSHTPTASATRSNMIAVSPACCGLGYLNQGPVDQEADQHFSLRPLVSESTQQGQQQEASGVLGLVPYVEHLRRQFGRGHEREGAHEDHGCPEGGF